MGNFSPILILHTSSQPYLSIARHYGGIKAFGLEYCYIPEKDALLQKKHMKKYNQMMKESPDSESNWNNFLKYVKSIKS